MSVNWIHANDYSMNTLLLFDRWIIRYIMNENGWYNNESRDYKTDMGKALIRYPHVVEFCKRKAPECTAFVDEVLSLVPDTVTDEELYKAETSILDYHDTFVVYAYPEIMKQLGYIRSWNPQRLYDLVELTNKIVLDVGAGTGRLTFAAAAKAKRVYASEPCDTLREYMRDKINKNGIANVKVLDGNVTNLPYENDTFDVVISGHVVGDFYDEEIAELTRVTKSGGWIVCCNGDDDFRRPSPDMNLVNRGFEFFCYDNSEGGNTYNHRKQIFK